MATRIALVVTIVTGLAMSGLAQRAKPDPVAASLATCEAATATWDLRAAMAAAYRAVWHATQRSSEHPRARDAWIALLRLEVLRGTGWRCRNVLIRMIDDGIVDVSPDAAAGLALIAYDPVGDAGQTGRTLEARLGASDARVIARLGASDRDAGGIVRLAVRAGPAVGRFVGEPLAALLVYEAACDRLAEDVSSVERVAPRLLRPIDALATTLDARPPTMDVAFVRGLVAYARWCVDGSRKRDADLAEARFRELLAAEPDHIGAAKRLAVLLDRSGRSDEALAVVRANARALLRPSRAWTGDDAPPAAPRYMSAWEICDAIRGRAERRGPAPALVALEREIDRAAARTYLELGNRFHPHATTAPRLVYPDIIENNVGFQCLTDWDLATAGALLRRACERGRRRPGGHPMAIALQNLGGLHHQLGDRAAAIEAYEAARDPNPRDAITVNNIGALEGLLATMDFDVARMKRAVRQYERAVELDPDYEFARRSLDFMRRVVRTWELIADGDRRPTVVYSLGMSFWIAANSMADSGSWLDALRILDRGFAVMASDPELSPILAKADIPGAQIAAPVLEKTMHELHDTVVRDAVAGYEALLGEHGKDNPYLNARLGEVLRFSWRHRRDPAQRSRALACYVRALAGAPDLAAAALGRAELLGSLGREADAIACVESVLACFLTPVRPWDGEPVVDPLVRPAAARRLVAAAAAMFGDADAWRAWCAEARTRIERVAEANPPKRYRDL